MTISFIILFVVFLIIGPIYWWMRNYCRIVLKSPNEFIENTLKWVWPITALIGIIFGLLAIMYGTII